MSLTCSRAFGILAIVCSPHTAILGQSRQITPSKRILAACDTFKVQMGDLGDMASSITSADESAGAVNLGTVAQLADERCMSVHSLLFAYELVSNPSDKAEVGEWVSFRMTQYAAIKTDIDFANKVIGLTKLSGVAREAQALRDRLRAFAELTATLRPSG